MNLGSGYSQKPNMRIVHKWGTSTEEKSARRDQKAIPRHEFHLHLGQLLAAMDVTSATGKSDERATMWA